VSDPRTPTPPAGDLPEVPGPMAGTPKAPKSPVDRLRADLSDEDRALVARLASEVVARRMTPAAIFLLESSKPLNFVASQAMVFFAPLLGMFVKADTWSRLAALLERRAFIDLLLAAIEADEDRFLSELRARKAAAHAARKAAAAGPKDPPAADPPSPSPAKD
jgi:hypothetical protein